MSSEYSDKPMDEMVDRLDELWEVIAKADNPLLNKVVSEIVEIERELTRREYV